MPTSAASVSTHRRGEPERTRHPAAAGQKIGEGPEIDAENDREKDEEQHIGGLEDERDQQTAARSAVRETARATGPAGGISGLVPSSPSSSELGVMDRLAARAGGAAAELAGFAGTAGLQETHARP